MDVERGFCKILLKYAVVILTSFFLFAFFPTLAGAVPVEPSRCWVQKDRDSEKLIIRYFKTARYKTEFQAANIKVPPAGPSRAGIRPDVRKVLTAARSLLGRPYVYGAAGPDSFDCSGFTLYVFKKVGINLPHLASEQAKYGVKVAKDELRPGDLVFFSYYGGSTIQHVGIYIGNGKFVHASSKKGVIITPLSNDYYAKNYKGASRLLPG